MKDAHTEDHRWSSWQPFNASLTESTIPAKPGVYEIRTDHDFGRLKGNSSIVTIGKADVSLKSRLYEQRFKNPTRNLDRAEKWLNTANHALEYRYIVTNDKEEARLLESEKQLEYENEHWELPPGNDRLELSALRKLVMQVYGLSTEQLVLEVIRGRQAAAKVADDLSISQAIITNLVVYFGPRTFGILE
jgi:hypothetical protein